MKKKHKHEWGKFKIDEDDKRFYIKCKIKTCKKVSFPNKPTQTKVRKKRIRYKTKGAFGGNK